MSELNLGGASSSRTSSRPLSEAAREPLKSTLRQGLKDLKGLITFSPNGSRTPPGLFSSQRRMNTGVGSMIRRYGYLHGLQKGNTGGEIK